MALLIVIVLSGSMSNAYGMATFAMRVGGPGSDDVWRSVEQFSGGGYMIAGNTDSFGSGGNDVWLVKLTEEGDIEWQRTYGGRGGDTARAIRNTDDGGFVVAGMTHSFSNGRSDVWVLKFDSDANLQWHKGYGGTGNEMAHAIEPTADGGYIVGGYTQSFGAQLKDYFVIKIDSQGVLEWARRYGGTGDDVIRIMHQTSNGDYLVAGFTHSFGTAGDIMILRVDSDGDIVWQKRYGGAKFEEPSSILEVDGGYIVMEQSTSFSKNTDGWMFKIDPEGNIVWQKRIGGTGFDEISAARHTPDGGFIVAAETKSFGAVNEDFWVVKFDSSANPVWQKRYGGAGIDEPEAIALTPEGGSIVVGTTKSFDAQGLDVWFLRLNEDGNVAQCGPGVTANMTTAASQGPTSASPQNTAASSIVVSPGAKGGNVAPKVGLATFAYQCGVSLFNIPPVAEDDMYATAEDVSLDVSALGVLDNDSDVDGDDLTAILVDPPIGDLVLSEDGGFEYTPAGNFIGTDTFTYKANDGTANSTIATVTISVQSVDDNPIAFDDAYTTDEDVSLNVSADLGVLDNDVDPDGDTLTANLVVDVNNGTLVLSPDGSFTYTPDADFNGTDTFTYTTTGGGVTSNAATVTITLTPINDEPIAENDAYTAVEAEDLSVNAANGVLENDSDIDWDVLEANLDTGPSHGTLQLNSDGSFTYTPDPGFTGLDTFSYIANDGSVDSNVATVNINVEPGEQSPP